MSRVVLDASAVLAVLNNERGAEAVLPLFRGASISAVNYGEVLKKAVEFGGTIAAVKSALAAQWLNVVPFDAEHAEQAASIWPQTKEYGLSFADRACVALGLLLGFPVLTAEARMGQLDLAVDIRLIRKPQ